MPKAKTYNKSLDLMLAAVLAQKEGKHQLCAKYIAQAGEDDSFDDAIDLVDAVNQEPEEDDDYTEEESLSSVLASLGRRKSVKAGGRRKSVKAGDYEELDLDEDDAEDDLEIEGTADDEDESSASDMDLDDTEVVESRLARARHNRAALAKITASAKSKVAAKAKARK
jgi:hypothetical protein